MNVLIQPSKTNRQLLHCVLAGLCLSGATCGFEGANINDNNNGAADPPVFQLSPNRRAVALIDPEGFDELLGMSRTEPALFLRPLVDKHVLTIAQHFTSAADFLIFMIDAHRDELRFNAVGGFNITIRAPEAGLGLFVNQPTLPNMDSLRSYIYLARKDSLVLGPGLHELAHAWGVRFSRPEVLGTQAEDSNNHWGFTSVGGQMGGWMPGSLVDLGAGKFKLSNGNIEPNGRSFNTVPYAPLELYIMGLLDARGVLPIEVAINPKLTSLFEFTADDIVEVTIEDIIGGNGTRVPSFENAQHIFGISIAVLTDHELSADEWMFYEDSMAFFAFDGALDIESAFSVEHYAGEPILELISTPDVEDSSRRFINFFEATNGLGDVEFIEMTTLDE